MHMIMKVEFVVKTESQVLPDGFRRDNRSSYQGKVNRGVRRIIRPCKMKELGFAMFHNNVTPLENFLWKYSIKCCEMEL